MKIMIINFFYENLSSFSNYWFFIFIACYQFKMFANNNVLKVTTVKTQFTIINFKVQLLTAFWYYGQYTSSNQPGPKLITQMGFTPPPLVCSTTISKHIDISFKVEFEFVPMIPPHWRGRAHGKTMSQNSKLIPTAYWLIVSKATLFTSIVFIRQSKLLHT